MASNFEVMGLDYSKNEHDITPHQSKDNLGKKLGEEVIDLKRLSKCRSTVACSYLYNELTAVTHQYEGSL